MSVPDISGPSGGYGLQIGFPGRHSPLDVGDVNVGVLGDAGSAGAEGLDVRELGRAVRALREALGEFIRSTREKRETLHAVLAAAASELPSPASRDRESEPPERAVAVRNDGDEQVVLDDDATTDAVTDTALDAPREEVVLPYAGTTGPVPSVDGDASRALAEPTADPFTDSVAGPVALRERLGAVTGALEAVFAPDLSAGARGVGKAVRDRITAAVVQAFDGVADDTSATTLRSGVGIDFDASAPDGAVLKVDPDALREAVENRPGELAAFLGSGTGAGGSGLLPALGSTVDDLQRYLSGSVDGGYLVDFVA